MDSKTIETLSVCAVKESIVQSPLLDQIIAENDKEPSWDGNVYIYNCLPKSKKNLAGRMPVQVKGKFTQDLSLKKFSYSMEIADLRNYLTDGGIVLFVVLINKKRRSRIYYAELTPVKLRTLIHSAGGQKSKSVELEPFPDDDDKKATIFLNCLKNCQMQASFVNGKLTTIDELQRRGILEELTIPMVGVGVPNPMAALFQNENYLYAKIKGTDIRQPIGLISKNNIITEEIRQGDICVAGKKYYSNWSIINSTKSTTLKIGNSLSACFDSLTQTCKINYKCTNSLRSAAIDIEFFIDVVEKQEIIIDGIQFPFILKENELKQFDSKFETEKLKFIQRAIQALNTLGYSGDIDTSRLTETDLQNLNRLITAFVDMKPVSRLNPNLPPIAYISVGELKFLLALSKEGLESGQYKLSEFYNSGIMVAYDNSDGEKIPTSLYSILRANDFLEIANLHLDQALASFQAFNSNENYFYANLFMLDLISAYDLSHGVRTDFLNIAKEFSTWLREAPDEALGTVTQILNEYQIAKRERSLTVEEQKVLWEIAGNDTQHWENRAGAYLLLDQQIPAEQAFAKLSTENQEAFIKYPIYHFWKKNICM